MASNKPPLIEKLHCNSCRITTKHILLITRSDGDSNEEYGYDWRTDYEVFECCGCSSVQLRRTYHFSEDPDSDVTFYPPHASRWLPKWQWSLPPDIRIVLAQIYAALQANSLALAMMGARTILDVAIIGTVGDHGRFADSLHAMRAKGYLSEKNCEFLEVVFDAGSASAHRAYHPDQEQMNTVMDIIENMLQSLYVLEKKAKSLKGVIPERPALVRPRTAKAIPAESKPRS
jgi:hypothetical protein